MKIEVAENGYIVETEDLYKYVFHTKEKLIEFIGKNVIEVDCSIVVKGCDVTK